MSWRERVYELVVALYPRGFRREYGPALRQAFREMALDGTVPAWRLWLAVLGDLPGSVLREHFEDLRGGDVSATRIGLAVGLLWTAVNMVNQGVTLDPRGQAIIDVGVPAALVLLYGLAGFAGARRAGAPGGIRAALVAWIVGSAIGVASMWLATWIFYQHQLADPGNLADFRRSGLPSVQAFLIDDNLRASLVGPAMSLAIGVVAGVLGAALGSRTRPGARTIGA